VNRIPFARLVVRERAVERSSSGKKQKDHFPPGQEIEILAGPLSGKQNIFKGIVTKLNLRIKNSGESMLTVDCRDPAVKMTVGKKSKYFSESKDSEIIQTIANEYELPYEVEDTPEVHETMVQYDSTDWNFILARAEANGLLILPENGKLVVQAPYLETTGDKPVCRFGSNLLALDLELDARTQYQTTIAKAWSPSEQTLLEAEATPSEWNSPGKDTPEDLANVIGLDGLDLYHTGARSDQELQQWTDAELLRSRLQKVRGRISLEGDSSLKPGMLIDLQGVHPRFSGTAFISGIRHEWGNDKWVMDLQLGLPDSVSFTISESPTWTASGLLPGVLGFQIGVVTRIHEDPKGEDRILVKAPVIDDQAEGVWARIATLDAGANRGSLFRPEIGDEVVLGFLNNDPRDAIIIGMLHSSAKPAPIIAEEKNPVKGFVTRSGLQLLFDDEKGSAELKTSKGKKLTLKDEEAAITLEDENGNKITLDKSGISLDSSKDINLNASSNIKLEGTNVNTKAKGLFKAEGSGGAEMTTPSVAVLKGSLVKIN
jgi:Rhs element Vgr protein